MQQENCLGIASSRGRASGFTIIELMIVVTIVSILAVIAMPLYIEYSTRSKVGEAMGFLAEAKTSVTESFYANNYTWPADNAAAGLRPAADYDMYDFVRRLEVSVDPARGSLIIVTLDLPGTPAHEKRLQLVPDTNPNQEIIWTCGPATTNGVEVRFIPANCR